MVLDEYIRGFPSKSREVSALIILFGEKTGFGWFGGRRRRCDGAQRHLLRHHPSLILLIFDPFDPIAYFLVGT